MGVSAKLPSVKDLKGKGLRFHLEYIEMSFIEAALHEAHGNVAQAARLLQISRGALENKMRKYGIVLTTSVIKKAG